MKTNITFLLAIVVLASCSAPKYSYYFDHTNYYAGKKELKSLKETSPLAIDSQELVATTSNQPVALSPVVESSEAPEATVRKTYLQMSKSERKALRHHLKKEIKSYVASKKADSHKSAHAGQAIDNDLKLAAIFGAVGIVGLIIGGDAFYIIGAIALLIGVVFFVKWLIRQ
jgi:hypothetical protein